MFFLFVSESVPPMPPFERKKGGARAPVPPIYGPGSLYIYKKHTSISLFGKSLSSNTVKLKKNNQLDLHLLT